jgi:hypothetical protein
MIAAVYRSYLMNEKCPTNYIRIEWKLSSCVNSTFDNSYLFNEFVCNFGFFLA